MTYVFDLHADLGWDIMRLKELGETHILENHHFAGLKAGEVAACAAASFFDGHESWHDMQQMITSVREEIEESDCRWLKKAEDFDHPDDRLSFVMTVEGMCGIHKKVKEKIDWMYEQGVRIASLEWNESNDLATGCQGDPARGLTDKGRKAVHEMNRLHMVIDVSHANEHTFWDLINESSRPLIATHSNCRSYSQVYRNMTDQQIIALCGRGGIIGMNTSRTFISEDQKEQNAFHLAMHAKHIADIAGHEHVACGFDYMDYYPSRKNAPKNDLYKAPQTQNFIHALKEAGFTEEEVEDIAWRNAYRFLKENL